ncbi:hypothetical protein DFH94DRAFT_639728 [Russula ochroleuca]|uniref:Uncharacterized protein n=1 Tax=Russula ochroleuca TaxID=152965 RepID=A0A9P5JUQ6_9AGAM|nr:hypothetical protein DFH94DRAFT_639728 [Russula ochroleuca]
MNHLSLGVGREGALCIILDPSDSMPMGKVGEDKDLLEPEDDVDLTTLRSDFLPDLNVLEQKAISHSLEGFSFPKDTNDEATLFLEDTPPVHEDGGALPEEDFFIGDHAVD